MKNIKQVRYIYIDIPCVVKILLTISHYKMRSQPLIADSDGDGVKDLMDKNPLSFDITDKIQSYVAGLAYTNFEGDEGKTIGELITSGKNFSTDHIAMENINILRNFEVIYADDSSGNLDVSDGGFGCVVLKLDDIGYIDSVVIGYRGTEVTSLIDWLTDLTAGIGLDHTQGSYAYAVYKKFGLFYGWKDNMYVTGHSLGGRLVQDALRLSVDYNNSVGFQHLKMPKSATTFNGFGYKGDIAARIPQSTKQILRKIITNYEYKYDLVGDGLGNSELFEKLGRNKGAWILSGYEQPNKLFAGYYFAEVHGITNFHKDERLN